nr:MAG TPA: hypothetical protein [Caudoviricetes sp.]
MGNIIAAIITAVVTGGITLLGVILANNKAQAVTEVKIEELTREVRKHNGFAEKIPVIDEKIKVINHRIEDLEKEWNNREN